MERKTYYYEVGMKRGKQDLYIRGVTSFIIDERDDGIVIISTQPPWINVLIKDKLEINNVANHWWHLFIGRLRKMSGSKTVVRPIVFKEVTKNEASE